ncbi:transposable element Tcb2 transposase [Trichonephila clavipes]|nr:transposable element Tcb2 transposase [Trichonephila clavipes]
MSITRRSGSGRSRQTNRQEDRHIVRNARVQPTASSATIQARVAPSLGTPVSSRTIRRCLAEGHLGSRCPLRVLPLTPTHRHLRLECSDDNRVRVWRPRSERLSPAFALQRPTAPTAGDMVWGAIAYSTQSPLVLIRGTMTAQRCVHDILQPHLLPLMQLFNKTMLGVSHGKGVTRLSPYCYYPS